MQYDIPDSPKDLRDTLLAAQEAIAKSPFNPTGRAEHISRLERAIRACNKHRPLDLNGEHTGKFHTATCGCEKKHEDSDIVINHFTD